MKDTLLGMTAVFLMLCGLLEPGAPTLGRDADGAGAGRDAAFAADGQLLFPADYREWVYLSSGFDMSYRASMQTDSHSFDNVFVNPAAYRAFRATGHWPDGTVLVLEVRRAQQRGSINRSGSFQGEPQGLEVHLRDSARFAEQWAFFGFDNSRTGKLIARSADCYACHAAHAAVDTTFVQFYPTLLPIAQRLGSLSPTYQQESRQRDQAAGP
jgi:hypothetical protein